MLPCVAPSLLGKNAPNESTRSGHFAREHGRYISESLWFEFRERNGYIWSCIEARRAPSGETARRPKQTGKGPLNEYFYTG